MRSPGGGRLCAGRKAGMPGSSSDSGVGGCDAGEEDCQRGRVAASE
jgi:hypothetical protein